MATKKISDLTAATSLASGDLFEIETSGGASRKMTAANVHADLVSKTSAGTIQAVHTLNPASAGAPFTLGANATGQLVTGLNADKVDGYDVTMGTWTPTIANTTNVAASASPSGAYLRVGATVVFWLSVQIDPTSATTLSAYTFSLPVASNLGALGDLIGSGNYADGATVVSLRVFADTTNDLGSVNWYTTADVANRTHLIHGIYRVI